MAILKTLYTDFKNNDLTTENFGIRLTKTKREYVEVAVKAKLELWLGEWYRDRGIGVPYLTEVLNGDPDFNIIETVLKAEALKVAYVQEVIGYEYTYNNATAEYAATLTLLIEGETEGNGSQTTEVSVSPGGL
jgi:hypothetical protein